MEGDKSYYVDVMLTGMFARMNSTYYTAYLRATVINQSDGSWYNQLFEVKADNVSDIVQAVRNYYHNTGVSVDQLIEQLWFTTPSAFCSQVEGVYVELDIRTYDNEPESII